MLMYTTRFIKKMISLLSISIHPHSTTCQVTSNVLLLLTGLILLLFCPRFCLYPFNGHKYFFVNLYYLFILQRILFKIVIIIISIGIQIDIGTIFYIFTYKCVFIGLAIDFLIKSIVLHLPICQVTISEHIPTY